MKKSVILLFSMVIIFAMAGMACGGGGSSSSSNKSSSQASDTSTRQDQDSDRDTNADEPEEPEPIDLSGTEARDFVDAWLDLGYKEADILYWLDTADNDTVVEWHMTQATADNFDLYEIKLKPGYYAIQGFCDNDQIENLDFYALNDSAENDEDWLDSDDGDDNYPLVVFEVYPGDMITLKVDPVSFVGDREKGLYAWYIYSFE